jgi:flavin reductase (DIM6/NTAB) family NADH-FMN oxidoreductase RutF
MTFDPDSFRSVLGRFASGVTVVTARDARDRDVGLTVSAFSSVSLLPPLIQICVNHEASVFDVLMQSTHFGVSILASEQEALSRRFSAVESMHRFEGIGFARGESGVVLLDEALAHLECRRTTHHSVGDHTMFIGEVERATARDGARPLLYYRGGYAQLER